MDPSKNCSLIFLQLRPVILKELFEFLFTLRIILSYEILEVLHKFFCAIIFPSGLKVHLSPYDVIFCKE